MDSSRNGKRNAKASFQKQSAEQDDPAALAWSRSIPLMKHGQSRSMNPNQLTRFFQDGQRLISARTHSTTQLIITKLASEGGLSRISELTKIDTSALSTAKKLETFETLMLPFLQIITNNDAMSSLLLEKPLGDIYVYIFGIGGRRAIPLFGSFADALQHRFNESTMDFKLHLWASTILAALLMVLECNQTASMVSEFSPVVDIITACLSAQAELQKDTLIEQSALQNLAKVKRFLKHGMNVPSFDSATSLSTQPVEPGFKLTQDGPGELSKEGPRHDNDHADFKKIMILPTSQEIYSQRPEYLPVKDPSEWHIQGIQGLLDQQFRLLREDTVGQLRDCVRTVMEDLIKHNPIQAKSKRVQHGPRMYKYSNVILSDVHFHKRRGFHLMAQFDQPESVRKISSPVSRKKWWSECKQLQIDALVCLVDSSGRSLFMAVCERGGVSKTRPQISEGGFDFESSYPQLLDPVDGSQSTLDVPTEKIPDLWSDQQIATVTLKLIDLENQKIDHILARDAWEAKSQQVLVEFPGVLLPSFAPTLQALQRMSSHGEVPFAEHLTPNSGSTTTTIAWPRYATQPGFYYSLDPISKTQKAPRLKQAEPYNFADMLDQTSLDDAQCKALIHALSNNLALIQGPPGTGKSYVAVQAVKILLDCRQEAELNPIICVCYTNHALDQFLEDIIASGTKQVIRIGAQSKSTVLESHNLRQVALQRKDTKTERQQAWALRKSVDEAATEVVAVLSEIKQASSTSSILAHLEDENPDHHQQLSLVEDSDGFQTVRYKHTDPIKEWLNETSAPQWPQDESRSLSTLEEVPLSHMSRKERNELFSSWVSIIRENLIDQFKAAMDDYIKMKALLAKCTQELDLRCLEEAHVIGVTTSGLARNVDLLRRVQPKVLLCEEAGEILEAHTLTALLPSIEHAILIGDHEQLRPQVQNYDLSSENPRGEKYSLNVSTFERLINGTSFPRKTLQTQRRMDPSISQLIRGTLYPDLTDHESVLEYPPVSGMRKRLYWLDHREEEARSDPSNSLEMSHSNDFEVRLVASIVTHLIRQGTYTSHDIVILTPYVRQLQKIRNVLATSFEIVVDEKDQAELDRQGLSNTDSPGPRQTHRAMLNQKLRIATVDNFQGEEATIIVVSLVRSNRANNCGFLRTTNRINVLLSRAKHGMYIVGNTVTSSHVQMWGKVISMLKDTGNIGLSLPLRCSQHPATHIDVSTPDDFHRYAPEGGCALQCNLRLDCGHACTFKCHSRPRHETVICQEDCERVRDSCSHPCPKSCGQKCGDCRVKIKQLALPCGHIKPQVECHMTLQISSIKCEEILEKLVPSCGHRVKVKCGIIELALARAKGHTLHVLMFAQLLAMETKHVRFAKKLAWFDAVIHTVPRNARNRAHHVPSLAFLDAPIKDNARCHVPFHVTLFRAPDVAKRLSSVAINVLLFVERNEAVVDYIEGLTYQEIDLDQHPVIVPECGHLMIINSMDGHMDMSSQYQMSEDEFPESLRSESQPLSIAKVKGCPLCRGSLHQIDRYNRIVKRAFLDEATKKFIVWSNARFVPLTIRLKQQEEDLANSDVILDFQRNDNTRSQGHVRIGGPREVQLHNVSLLSGLRTRHSQITQLLSDIANFYAKVIEDEQPFSRVQQMVEAVARKTGAQPTFTYNTEVLQTRSRLMVTSLLLRCELALMSDIVKIRDKHALSMARMHPWLRAELSLDFQANRLSCLELAKDAIGRQQPMIEIEARLLFGRYVGLERAAPIDPNSIQELLSDAVEQIERAKLVVNRSPSTVSMLSEIVEVERLLRGSTFYSIVTNEEKQAVYNAMAQEFQGTGHWYYCVNMHPFTVADCGAPTITSRCPECGEPVGGSSHRSVDGVSHARDLEAQFGALRV